MRPVLTENGDHGMNHLASDGKAPAMAPKWPEDGYGWMSRRTLSASLRWVSRRWPPFSAQMMTS